jgi:nucleoside 2-deoxyribosyltransferase
MSSSETVTKVYWAAPLFTPTQREVGKKVCDWLKEDPSFEVFIPAESSAAIWKGRPPAACTPAEREQVFTDNWTNIEWADVLLAWVGGMDEILHKAGAELAHAVEHLISEHRNQVPGYHLAELQKALAGWDEKKAAPTDTGVTWEMGFSYGTSTPVLAYIDDADARQSMNLMLELGVQGVARGFEDLQQQLLDFHTTGEFSESGLEPEQEAIA